MLLIHTRRYTLEAQIFATNISYVTAVVMCAIWPKVRHSTSLQLKFQRYMKNTMTKCVAAYQKDDFTIRQKKNSASPYAQRKIKIYRILQVLLHSYSVDGSKVLKFSYLQM